MKIVNYHYRKRGQMEFTFDTFPYSPAILAQIKDYYFIRYVKWSNKDREITNSDLKEMEILANRHMGTILNYMARKGYSNECV